MLMLAPVLVLWNVLRGRLHAARADHGAFTLEVAVVAAGLLALAIGLIAVLVAAVHNHEASIK
jgi:uncharacterized membrane protein